MPEKTTKKKIVTHSAGFHADDVFAVATLLIYLKKNVDEVEIIRTRDEEIIKSGDFAVDIGFTYDPDNDRFDHHQKEDTGAHDSGIPYASFGLVWKKYGNKVCDSEAIAREVERLIVEPIDAGDNAITLCEKKIENVAPFSVGRMIQSFSPDMAASPEVFLEAFKRAVILAKEVLENEISMVSMEESIRPKIIGVYKDSNDKRIVILDDAFGWSRIFISMVLIDFPEPIYFIREHLDKVWQIICVQDEGFVQRKTLPEEWRGLEEKDLAKVTGVRDALFCHKSGFMCVTKSKEGALALANKALEN